MDRKRWSDTEITAWTAISVLIAGVLMLMHSFSSHAVATLFELLESNQMLQALLLPSALGGLAWAVAVMGKSAFQHFVGDKLYSSLTIESSELEAFEAVLEYSGTLLKSTQIMAIAKKKTKSWREYMNELVSGQKATADVVFRPANTGSVHMLAWKGRRLLMSRKKGTTITVGHSRKPVVLETLSLTALGTDTSVLMEFVEEAVQRSKKERARGELSIYVAGSDWLGGWEKALTKRARPVESVILDESLAESVRKDALEFLASAAWYASAGIPYRRGYLLYGPPVHRHFPHVRAHVRERSLTPAGQGCGKSSFCEALAGALHLDVCMLSLSNKGLDDTKLSQNLREAPIDAMILLEDVDSVFRQRELQKDSKDASGVTFSGLLNAIDGVASQEGRIFVMTTNHVDRLDPALIRPGRCDVKIEVRNASKMQMRKLFLKFFPGRQDLAQSFASRLPADELSMAQIQAHLLEHKASSQVAIDSVPRLLRLSNPQSSDRLDVKGHLRRVGLERYAYLFEREGYVQARDLEGLKVDDVKQWSVSLKMDVRAVRVLADLLEKRSDRLNDEYKLADKAAIKDIFVSKYQCCDSMDDVVPGETERLLERLARTFTDALVHNGRSTASVWQVTWLVSELCPNEPNQAVEAAKRLLGCDDEFDAGEGVWEDGMPTYVWLRRIGLLEYIHDFLESGLRFAEQFQHYQKDCFKKLGVKKEEHVAAMLAAIKPEDASQAYLSVHYQCPSISSVRKRFLSVFPTSHAEADAFARRVTTRMGFGLASALQIDAHLRGASKRKEGASWAVETAVDELLVIKDPERSTTEREPVPTEWVHGWLKAHSLERFSRLFVAANLLNQSDLAAEPCLSDADLEGIGVDTLGERRKICRMIGALRDAADV